MNMRFSIAVLLTMALPFFMIAGCAKVSMPEENLAERLQYDDTASRRYQVDDLWWKTYQDDRLNRLVDEALKNNVDLAQAAVKVNRALYQAGLLATDLVPQFSGSLDASARKNVKNGGPSTRSAGGSLSLSYELDLWRKVADSVSAQQWEYKATVEDKEAARQTLIGSTVDAYFHLAYLNDAIGASEDNLKNYRSIYETVRAKQMAGKVASVETAQARQSVLSAENTLNDYQSQHKSAEQTLRNLLNLKPNQPLGLEKATLAKLRLPGLDLNIPLAVLANRPDLKAAEMRLEKAFKQVEEAEKGWLPSITLGAAIGSTGDSLKTAFNLPVGSGSVNINLPFLQWDKVRLNLRISEADFESVRLDLEKALTTALNEVDTYYSQYDLSRESLANTRKKYISDIEVGQYYRDRYQAGKAELSDWLSALNTVNSSRLSALNGLYQTVQYEVMTQKAMSGRYVDLLALAEAASEAVK